jgi:hypothetical protein
MSLTQYFYCHNAKPYDMMKHKISGFNSRKGKIFEVPNALDAISHR